MDSKNQDNQSENLKQSLHRDASPHLKKHRIGKGMLVFLVGILVGVVLMGLYTIAIEELKRPNSQTQTPSVQSSEPSKDKITEEDLNNYIVAQDCSTLSEYNAYTISLSRLPMKTISLDESLITAGRGGGTNYIRWKNLPDAVNHQCDKIKLSDIKAGDLLNIYTMKNLTGTSDSEYSSDTRVIQKVSE
jgi:hypothetical protein